MNEIKTGVKERVTDIITEETIRQWNDGDVVTISAGCGTGKSYFIKNVLYEIAKRDNNRILMLMHRTNPVKQFQNEIKRDGKEDVIEIMTYQKIEKMIIEKRIKKTKQKNKRDFHFITTNI